jgi:hypothetical protein
MCDARQDIVRAASVTRAYGERMSAPAPRPPSFLRRHPILAGFGVLAGLSLFAAYWPASAVITGVVVAGRASGADVVVWRRLRTTSARIAGLVQRAWREHEVKRSGVEDGHQPPTPAEPPPALVPPEAGPAAKLAPGNTVRIRAPLRRSARARRVATREHATAGVDERELGG